MNENSPKNFELPEKLPPQNIEAEQCLLGCLMLDKKAITKVADFLEPRDFYKGIHQEIYQSMLDLFEKAEPIDLLSVSSRLREKNKLEEVGGRAYLTTLINSVPTATHILNYAKIVQKKRILRNLIEASYEIGLMGYNETEDTDILLDKAEKRIFSIAQKSLSQNFVSLKKNLEEAFDRIDRLSKHGEKLRGLPTGFTGIDNILSGLQKSDLIILASRPSLGKCVSKNTEVVNPNPGTINTIEEIVKDRKKEVLTLDKNLKISKSKINNFIDDGKKPVFQIKTALGKEIETTITHPFLTIKGWKPLGTIKVGDRIAVPRIIPIFGKTNIPDYQVKCLSYFISEGGLTSNSPRFTNTNKYIVNDFIQSVLLFSNVKVKKEGNSTYCISGIKQNSKEAVKKIAKILKEIVKKSGLTQMKLAQKTNLSFATISAILNGHYLPLPENFERILSSIKISDYQKENLSKEYYKLIPKNNVTEWLKSLELMGKLSKEKIIPKIVFTFTKEKLSLFLNRLFACDGSFYQNKKGDYHISYCSASKKLIKQVQHLLLRFGIISKIRKKTIKRETGIKIAYELEVHNAKNLIVFIKEIGIYGKEKQLKKAKKTLSNIKLGWTQDTLPIEIWKRIVEIKGEKKWSFIYSKLGLSKNYNIHAFRRHPQRETVAKLAEIFHSQELSNLSRSDIYWDRIISIKYKGRKQVYDLTIPETHNFIANDFIIHNSSLSLDIARYIATHRKVPVGIFSLEMSKDQIVDRLIASQANIDLWRLRTGRLTDKGEDNDFVRINQAIGILSEAPIFIDDAVTANVLQMRAMSRRLQAQYGLGLIIIDYLQLIESRSQNLSTVQQMSEISRSLKGLARELNVPVLALSQLSRAVEQRTPQVPRLSDLRESGCLAGDTLIIKADTGERVSIKELAERKIQKPFKVLAVDENYKLKPHLMTNVFYSGKKMIFELKTRSGRKIKASANHPFLKLEGWKRLDELKINDFIALPRNIEIKNPSNPLSKKELILLAHLLGDGCILPNQPFHYTSADKENIQTVKETAKQLFNINGRIIKQKNWYHLYLPSPYPTTHKKYHPITNWFKKLGIERVHSWKKQIPQAVFECDRKKIALFLRHLWATDGNLSWKQLKGRKPAGNIYYATSSQILAHQVQHLLLRLEIQSSLRTIVSKKKYRIMYHIYIDGANEQLKFLNKVGIVGKRKRIIPSLIISLKKIAANTNVDIIPKIAWKIIIEPAKEKSEIGWREVAKRLDISYCGSTLFKHGISRERMMRLYLALEDSGIHNLAKSDIFWDKIVSIKPLGTQDVYDATVKGAHNFVANDIILHNSIEQDSDVVLFIHRPDKYQDDAQKNIAEIIIAKHRNGPVGMVKLYFDEQRATFRNLEKEEPQ